MGQSLIRLACLLGKKFMDWIDSQSMAHTTFDQYGDVLHVPNLFHLCVFKCFGHFQRLPTSTKDGLRLTTKAESRGWGREPIKCWRTQGNAWVRLLVGWWGCSSWGCALRLFLSVLFWECQGSKGSIHLSLHPPTWGSRTHRGFKGALLANHDNLGRIGTRVAQKPGSRGGRGGEGGGGGLCCAVLCRAISVPEKGLRVSPPPPESVPLGASERRAQGP